MKKSFKIATLLLSAVMCGTVLAGCGGNADKKTVYELPHYDGSYYAEESELPDYNEELWYRNNTNTGGADPMVLDNTSIDGRFYRYSGNIASSSTDLVHWVNHGPVIVLDDGWTDLWASEVVYEDLTDDGVDNGRYYMYFSASFPNAAGSGAYKKEDSLDGLAITTRTSPHSLYVGISSSPLGPFEIANYSNAASVGAENVRTIEADKYSYDSTYVRYALFEPLAMNEAYSVALYDRWEEGDDYMTNNIDPHPFIDPVTQKKYLLFNDERQPSPILIVEMENWLTPKYDTLKVIARSGYYTVEDFDKAQKGEQVETISFEQLSHKVQEGAFMYYRNGKYYLTCSINGYMDPEYTVIQMVSDRPDGGFRKLTQAENGFMLSGDNGGNKSATGTGHHCFFEANGKLYICYHRHTLPNSIAEGRVLAIDEIKWVTIQDKNGNDLDVMYVNGPTVTVQPTIRTDAEYRDISEKGTVSLVNGEIASDSSLDYLNDGLLSYNLNFNQEFLNKYVKETEITTTTTFEMTFAQTENVRGIMIYNSKYQDKIFRSIKDMEFLTEENGVEKTYYISELQLDEKTNIVYNEYEALFGNKVIDAVTYGGGVYAEFNALNVKKIRFTVEIPQGQSRVGISEIAVMGKVN